MEQYMKNKRTLVNQLAKYKVVKDDEGFHVREPEPGDKFIGTIGELHYRSFKLRAELLRYLENNPYYNDYVVKLNSLREYEREIAQSQKLNTISS